VSEIFEPTIAFEPSFVPRWTSRAAGVLNADLLLRLPLDDFWPGFHLAPYVFGGFGAFFAGGGGEAHTINPQNFIVIGPTNNPNVSPTAREVTITGQRISRIRNISSDRVLGRIGGGLEYRFTPNFGIFSEVSYNFPNLSGNNFVQWELYRLEIRLLTPSLYEK
jgi:hypothetical protein